MAALVYRIWRELERVRGLQNLLMHFLNPHFLVGCTGVILDAEGRVLLFRHSYRRRCAWGTPGGWLRRGEQAAAGLVREVMEESGLRVTPVAPLAAGTDPDSARMEILYWARFEGGEVRLSDEIDEIRWFALDEDLPPDMKPLQRRAVDEVRRLFREDRLPEPIHV